MSAPQSTYNLLDLPNEILHNALYRLPTATLLQTRPVNHYFCNVVGQIIKFRLQKTLRLDDWRLIIECYHPSRARSEKYNFCEYLDTPGLSPKFERHSPHDDTYGPGFLPSLQARFRPTNMTPERSNNRRDPAGGAPGSKNVEVRSEAEHAEERPVERVLHLDSDENFSQLIFSASLVQLGPARGVFKALAEVIDKKAVRIFRKWLSDRAGRNGTSASQALVWLDDHSKVAGLDIAVDKVGWRGGAPLLVDADEDEAVTYTLELKELRISLLHLLLGLEGYLLQSNQDMGKAMIFGSFPASSSQPEQT